MLDPTARTAPPNYVHIGRCGRAFQVSGAFRLQLDAPAEDYLSVGTVLFITGLGKCSIRELNHSNGRLTIAVRGVRNRTQATGLLHEHVYLDATELSDDERDDLEITDDDVLLGLPVTVNGETVGTITETHLSEAYDYLGVTLASGKMVLLPLEAPYITLDEAGLHVTDPPAGLLNE